MDAQLEIRDQRLSPVLSNSKSKGGVARRKKPRFKSRIKLDKMFNDDNCSSNSLAEDTITQTSQPPSSVLDDENVGNKENKISVQNESLLAKVEESELEEKEKLNEFNFKMPLSPAPRKYMATRSLDEPNLNMPLFQTANGKPIIINEDKLKTCTKLFDDIYNLSQENNEKKFNFLKKSSHHNYPWKPPPPKQTHQTPLASLIHKHCNSSQEEISELSVSNSQLLSAVDKILESNNKRTSQQFDWNKNDLKELGSFATKKSMEESDSNKEATCESEDKKRYKVAPSDTSDDDNDTDNNSGNENGNLSNEIYVSDEKRVGIENEESCKSSVSDDENNLLQNEPDDLLFDSKINGITSREMPECHMQGFQTAGGKSIVIPQMVKHNKMFAEFFNSLEIMEEDQSVIRDEPEVIDLTSDTEANPITPKPIGKRKRLGIGLSSGSKKPKLTSSTPIQAHTRSMSAGDYSRIKEIFGEEDCSDIFGTARQLSNIEEVEDEEEERQGHDATLMPENTCSFQFKKPTEQIDLDDWWISVEEEQIRLEMALAKVKRKKAVLERIMSNVETHTKPKEGYLYLNKKQYQSRMTLRNLGELKKPGQDSHLIQGSLLFTIDANNANRVHFSSNGDVIVTEDGCEIVPNEDGQIGLAEICVAFRNTPAVDPKLIPDGWLENHYRWIVWKLAAYERMYPIEMNGSFSVAEVAKQLKYRYDREIDMTQRSAVRLICEQDGSPQRRMVLVVSKIKEIELGGRYELELSDGWYGIRTVIDNILSYQVFKGKVRIGTKLITCSAELDTYRPFHPLDAPESACLRIHSNSTRIARWDVKLGYCRYHKPFAIRLGSVYASGGLIGRLDVYIARTYPIKFMERKGNDSQIVWRNKKAEDQAAMRWETERSKRISKIQQQIKQQYEQEERKDDKSTSKVIYTLREIEGITCPQTLYNIYRTSADPDSVREMFSLEQRQLFSDYQHHRARQIESMMNARIKDSAANLCERNVVGLWKVRIVDVNNLDESSILNVWNPSSDFMQTLAENTFITLCNVNPGRNNELSVSSKTQCRTNMIEKSLSDFAGLTRTFVPIEALFNPNFKPIFNEFDTVGILVETNFEDLRQKFWLADCFDRIMEVQIREPKHLLILLDNLNVGQIMSVCNIRFKQIDGEFVDVEGDYNTITVKYSRFKHIQEASSNFKKDIPTNLNQYIMRCKQKISERSPNTLKTPQKNNDTLEEENTLDPLSVTLTDEVMSSLDIDKLLNN
ncbi:uncharacterized protein LOC109594117 isoform X2 [Aethina tumida]|uniref:uncharacterized protein LOC109594117 isoform X2 n=1 Tax=Aethina tumida TaxID=116153 RepID=UPI00096B34C0|nr:uncharacterized protein LOC109594117 isoform X2 [Aethina tumida]